MSTPAQSRVSTALMPSTTTGRMRGRRRVPVVHQLAQVVVEVLLQQRPVLQDALSKQLLEDKAGLRAQLAGQLIASANPRAISSGVYAVGQPFRESWKAWRRRSPRRPRTSRRRSRGATVEMSPTARPSTNMTPAMRDPPGAPACRLDDRAVLGKHGRTRGHAGVSRHLRLGGEHPKYSPCTNICDTQAAPRPITVRISLPRICRVRERARAAISSKLPGKPPPRRHARAELIVSCTRSSIRGTAFAEMITVSPRSTSTVGWSAMRDPGQRGHRLTLAARAEDDLSGA